MKKIVRKFIMGVMILTLVLVPTTATYASTKTDAEQMLKYYKQGKISKAKKYSKKLPKKASKACIRRLSSKEKAAYSRIVKKYPINNSSDYSKSYMWGYYLADVDGDKKAELLIKYGSCEADVRTIVYDYKKGKVRRVGKVWSGHTEYYAYPGHAGVIAASGHMGFEVVSTLNVKNGKVKVKQYGSHYYEAGQDYFNFPQALYGHIKYDANYKRSLDLKDLK